MMQSNLKFLAKRSTTLFKKRLRHMYFPKNFAEVLRTPILQNADRLLLLKHLLKMKITAPDKFDEEILKKNHKYGKEQTTSKKQEYKALLLLKYFSEKGR